MGRWKDKGGRVVGEVVGRWKGKGGRKVGEVLILKKKKIRNNYRKIGKEKDNDVEANITQLEHNNNKYGVLAFIYIYIYKLI